MASNATQLLFNLKHKTEIDIAIYVYVFPVILLLGLVGGCFNVVVLWASKQMQSVHYIYLRWLAVMDLSFVVVTVSALPYMAHLVEHTHASMFYWSKVYTFAWNTFSSASNGLIAVLTVDRYLAVCQAVRFRNQRTRKAAHGAIAACFVVMFVVNMPMMFRFDVVRTETGNGSFYDYTFNGNFRTNVFWAYVWLVLQVVVGRVAPLMCIVVLNPLIARAQTTRLQRRHLQSAAVVAKAKDERRLFQLLLAASLTYVVCTVPVTIGLVTLYVNKALFFRSDALYAFLQGSKALSAVNHAANFYIYSCASADFREAIRALVVRTRVAPASLASASQKPAVMTLSAPS